MPGVILNGVAEPISGLACKSWHDDARLRLRIGEDGAARPRGTWVRAIVLHTTRGIPGGSDLRPQQILPGVGPARETARRTNHWWSHNGTSAGAHLVVDFDGSVSCLADLASEQTFHATSFNRHTIGIEIAQGTNAELWQGQLEAVVALVDWITLRFQIQRQIPDKYRGPIARLRSGGRDVVGVYGHRDQSPARGVGDPGDAVFGFLSAAGYERVDLSSGADISTWKRRQRMLGAVTDGIPGPSTCAAVCKFQQAHGIRVTGLADITTRVAMDAGATP